MPVCAAVTVLAVLRLGGWDGFLVGLPASHLSRYAHPKEKLAFYSKGTVDIMFKYPFGVQELWGDVLAENGQMLELCSELGMQHRSVPHDPGLVRVSLAL